MFARKKNLHGHDCAHAREPHQIVLAKWHDFNRRREARRGGVVFKVLRDDALAALLDSAWHVRGDEADEGLGVALVEEEKVDALGHLLDLRHLAVSPVSQDKLFDQVERALVVDALAELHDGGPRHLGRDLVAVWAVQVVHAQLDHQHLLQHHIRERFLLNGELDLQAPGVGLGINEGRVDELHEVEALDAFQADGKQLLRLEVTHHPPIWGVEVASTTSAALDDALARDALADVDARL